MLQFIQTTLFGLSIATILLFLADGWIEQSEREAKIIADEYRSWYAEVGTDDKQ
ncbi:hypothetical protein AO364_1214 [Moraxella catarrhalis]|uniref:hypothetical protein n=1 Tax=Moraxella catarrhalis TaxID=480 RepID=UPI0007F4FA6A|nr:hypothetical protein [Moraxella catarrhalis]OAV36046.1 hypothetical protein AO364_1214 [Moraxella catarrhalis]